MSPDGKDQKLKAEDHDLLMRIDERLGSFIKELRDLKAKVAWHEKVIYMGLGGIALLQFLLKVYR